MKHSLVMTMYLKILNVSLLLFSSCLLVDCLSIPYPVTSIVLHEYTQCPGKDGLALVFKDTTLNQANPYLIDITGKILMKEEVKERLSMKLSLQKCKSRADSNCEHYTTAKFDKLCSLMTRWKSYFTDTTLPSGCPFAKGEYSLNHVKIDQGMLLMLPLSESEWKVVNKFFMNDTMIGCLFVRFSIKRGTRKVQIYR